MNRQTHVVVKLMSKSIKFKLKIMNIQIPILQQPLQLFIMLQQLWISAISLL